MHQDVFCLTPVLANRIAHYIAVKLKLKIPLWVSDKTRWSHLRWVCKPWHRLKPVLRIVFRTTLAHFVQAASLAPEMS